MRHVHDFDAVDGQQLVIFDQARFGGRRIGDDADNCGPAWGSSRRLALHAQEGTLQGLPFLHGGDDFFEAGQRYGEADAGVVPFAAGPLLLAAGRERHADADDAAIEVNQRTAVVRGAEIGVRLHRLGTDATGGGNDARGESRLRVAVTDTQCHGPLTDCELFARCDFRHGQSANAVHLQQTDAAGFVAAEEPGDFAFSRRQANGDNGRLANEVKGAGNDVTVR